MSPSESKHFPLLKRLAPWIWGVVAVAVGVLGALAVGTVYPGWSSPASGQVGNGLFIPPDRLDFGQEWECKEFTWVLPITNPSREDVEIEHFSTTCNCTKTEPSALLIPAGETREIRLLIDLTPGAKATKEESESRAFEVALGPKLKGRAALAMREWWVVRGTVRPLMHLDRPVIDFGIQSELSQPLSPQRVLVTSAIPLKELKATSDSPLFVPVVKGTESGGRNQFELLVSVLSQSTVGPIQGVITITAQPESAPSVTKPMKVMGRIVKDCQAHPPEARFGARSVGEVVDESVALLSFSKRSFTVVDTKVEGEGLSVEKTSLSSGQDPTYRLRQQILKKGEQGSKVVFKIKPLDGETVEVIVPVLYLGIDP